MLMDKVVRKKAILNLIDTLADEHTTSPMAVGQVHGHELGASAIHEPENTTIVHLVGLLSSINLTLRRPLCSSYYRGALAAEPRGPG